MAGRNQRTLNPMQAFYGDGRFSRLGPPFAKNHKIKSAQAAFAVEWPDEKWPHFAGSAYVVYDRLKAAGWIYSTRYGWRKKGAT